MSYDIQSMQVRSGLDLDQDCMIIIPGALDLSITGINHLKPGNREQLKAKTRRLAGSVWFCLLI
jgi:hypothetical protein